MPRKFGQHFLIDRSVAARIVDAAQISAGDAVVEVGPGRGALTHVIADSTPTSLTLIEIDPALAADLRTLFVLRQWVSVIEADARTFDPTLLPGGAERPYKLLANLPYYAAAPIIRNFLESARPPLSAVVMVQREVAAEMAAKPGEMGLMSVGVQLYADVEVLFDVPPTAFRPPPKVTSTVVRLTVLPQPRLNVASRAEFFEVVRAGFRAPRKQLRNSLALGLNIDPADAAASLISSNIDPERRPATLTISDWGMLYEVVRKPAHSQAVVVT